MIATQVFFSGNQHAFHLFLDFRQMENKLYSTIQVCHLERLFPLLFAKIKHSFVADAFAADELLQELAIRILKSRDLQKLFYPSYLLDNGRVSIEIASQIANYNATLFMPPRTYYTQLTEPPKFFVITNLIERVKCHTLRTSRVIGVEDFIENYILNNKMMNDFDTLKITSPTICEVVDNEGATYVLVFNKKMVLQMFLVL